MRLKIPKYSEDRSVDIGKLNIEALRKGEGRITFTGAYIHLAPACNFRCNGCYTHVELCEKIMLGYKTIRRIVDFARDRGAKTIIFAGAGEPTLDPEFEGITRYIRNQKLKTVLFTNMTTIKNVEKAREYLTNGPVITKLFTLDEGKYKAITHNKNAFKDSMKGLGLLLDAREELEGKGKRSTLALESYITRENQMDLPDLLRFCREKKIIPYFEAFIETCQPGRVIKRLSLSEKELAQLFMKLRKIDKEEFDIDTKIPPWSRIYGMDVCNKATHMFSVREDGNLHMCICSPRKIGSVYDQEDPYKSLEKIFNAKNKWLLDYFSCDRCSKRINPKFLKA